MVAPYPTQKSSSPVRTARALHLTVRNLRTRVGEAGLIDAAGRSDSLRTSSP